MEQQSSGKMKSLTIQEKLSIINMVENGKSLKEVAEELSINRNTLHYILKNREKIKAEIGKKPGLSNQKRIKQSKNPELEMKILNLLHESREKGEKMTGSIIKAIALEEALKMNINNFAASNGWLFSFFKRNAISINDFNKVDSSGSKDLIYYEAPKTSDIKITQKLSSDIDVVVKEDYVVSDVFECIEAEEEELPEYTGQWKNWCRFCGNEESLPELDSNQFDIIQRIFDISSEEDVKICCECCAAIDSVSKLIFKARFVESMFLDLEERDRLNCLTDENVITIRQEYGIDESASTADDHENETNEMNEEIVYEEEDYLEEEIEVQESMEYESLNLNETNDFKSIKILDEDNYIFQCHICNEKFERMCFLTNHARNVHNCLPQVACTCGKYLATWDSLMSHKRKHTCDEANFVCDICQASFVTKTGLSIHIKFKHEKEQPVHVCSICSKEFKDSQVLKNHERTHLPDHEKFSYECEICSKKLSNKYSLKHHILTVHEQHKTILCHLCSRGFSNKSNLRSHLISHTTENVVCNICNSTFKNRVSLQSHKKIHKPKELLNFSCFECGKRFHNRNHLERHMPSHTGIRSFKCTFEKCEADFKWEKDLRNHMSRHYGERRHKCLWCDRSFVDGANLRKHKLKYHPDETCEYDTNISKKRHAKHL